MRAKICFFNECYNHSMSHHVLHAHRCVTCLHGIEISAILWHRVSHHGWILGPSLWHTVSHHGRILGTRPCHGIECIHWRHIRMVCRRRGHHLHHRGLSCHLLLAYILDSASHEQFCANKKKKRKGNYLFLLSAQGCSMSQFVGAKVEFL
jgi:hypothetical protein